MKYLRYWDYTEQEDDPLTCPKCGWVGLPGKYIKQYDDLFDVCCPKCREMLLIVMFPTIMETREAAAAGNKRAAAELPAMEARVASMRSRYDTVLRSPERLPTLPGDGDLIIEWDMEKAEDEFWTVLRVDGQEIWREAAFWEGIGRFETVVSLLREKYGRRLVEVRPTDRSKLYLLGDDLRAPSKVEKINAALREGSGGPGTRAAEE